MTAPDKLRERAREVINRIRVDHWDQSELQLIHAALIQTRDEALEEAERLMRRMRGHDHWDRTQKHGAGCQLCITQREAFAAKNSGETYTGTRWIFHKFGPWSKDVNDRVPTAVEEIEASRNVYESKQSGKEATRYEAEPDEHLVGRLEQLIPASVAAAVRRSVKTYGNDTHGLLREVYLTTPMLNAAPGEELDLRLVTQKSMRSASPTPSGKPAKIFSVNTRKRIAEEVSRRLSGSMERRTATSHVPPEPRYDGVFEAGIRWLDDLPGTPMPESSSGELVFSDGLWKDAARVDTEE